MFFLELCHCKSQWIRRMTQLTEQDPQYSTSISETNGTYYLFVCECVFLPAWLSVCWFLYLYLFLYLSMSQSLSLSVSVSVSVSVSLSLFLSMSLSLSVSVSVCLCLCLFLCFCLCICLSLCLCLYLYLYLYLYLCLCLCLCLCLTRLLSPSTFSSSGGAFGRTPRRRSCSWNRRWSGWLRCWRIRRGSSSWQRIWEISHRRTGRWRGWHSWGSNRSGGRRWWGEKGGWVWVPPSFWKLSCAGFAHVRGRFASLHAWKYSCWRSRHLANRLNRLECPRLRFLLEWPRCPIRRGWQSSLVHLALDPSWQVPVSISLRWIFLSPALRLE